MDDTGFKANQDQYRTVQSR